MPRRLSPDEQHEHARQHEADRALRLERWNTVTAWPMFAAAVAFFILTSWFFAAPHPGEFLLASIGLALIPLWLLFLADAIVQVSLSPKHRRLSLLNLGLIGSLLVPMLRPFLILPYLWRLPVFRTSARMLRTRMLVVIALFALLFTYAASLGVWLAERGDPKSNINSFDDAIFWGFATITTVGYGDYVPITFLGRLIAVLLMVCGVAIIGVVSAAVVSEFTSYLQAKGLLATGASATEAAPAPADSAALPTGFEPEGPPVGSAPDRSGRDLSG